MSLALATACACVAAADPLHAWQAGERGAAIEAWRAQAEQGDAEAARWYALSSAQVCPSELSAGGVLGD